MSSNPFSLSSSRDGPHPPGTGGISGILAPPAAPAPPPGSSSSSGGNGNGGSGNVAPSPFASTMSGVASGMPPSVAGIGMFGGGG
eukprot:CAMPEP_0194283562 /NCGR_PEP_ID=MMETSP0169-20130528/25667_1 /TAXON_ID=218684 /ORGANISM="Corethron pennatum, Strain L29A3" /LENGTH=84 /DNA_ID=CAMNT_0039029185 /DNA_START=46 /DNA_END=296 /DNA_ORIENTATION=+